ncbi:WD repeat-containing protein 88-like [Polypterus senegalus]|uniref:WD repeat-containing protein 88-like n=1 Tax=Polypterus senegalus TaxID=55291 RepID=UPI0019668358|nr:WD repeat-containing protein 88-like [Polypterus senegalus]
MPGDVDPLAVTEVPEKQPAGENESVNWEHQYLSQIPFKVLRGHSDAVSCCHFCFNDNRILTSSHDKTIKLWDINYDASLITYEGGHSAPIVECALISNNKRFVTASWDKTVKCWDFETQKILWTAVCDGLVTCCDVSPDGKYITCGSDMENSAYILDAGSGKIIKKLKDHHKSTVTACRFDPDSQRVASVSSDKTIKLWDLVAQRTTLNIKSGHLSVISDCSFSKNGFYLCTASWDKKLLLWDIKTGMFRSCGAVALDHGHTGSISSCKFSHDSSFLVSGAYDKTLTLWDTEARCKKIVLKGHEDWVMDTAITTDKKWIASSSKDMTLRLWNTENLHYIPSVIESQKTVGLKIVMCKECGKPFSINQMEDLEIISRCVFCRFNDPLRNAIPSPPTF